MSDHPDPIEELRELIKDGSERWPTFGDFKVLCAEVERLKCEYESLHRCLKNREASLEQSNDAWVKAKMELDTANAQNESISARLREAEAKVGRYESYLKKIAEESVHNWSIFQAKAALTPPTNEPTGEVK